MPVFIRPAGRRDLDDIVRLWRGMWDLHVPLDARFEPGPAADRVMRELVDDHLENDRSRVLVSESEGRVTGYVLGTILENPPITGDPSFGYVSDLAIEEASRGSGTGTLLLEALHDWFRAKGIRSAEVQVSIRNEAARDFWRSRGYTDFLERLHRRL